jgi:vanillate O-demethylase ferredoxin subunit
MIEVIIRSIRLEAEGVRSFELVPAGRESLPPWSPGAHIQVRLPAGLQRAYSLCNHPGEDQLYRIAVKLEANSRGGSQAMHRLQVGERLRIGAPTNLFEIDASASHHVLLAGGIGITPLYAMRNALGTAAELHYFARSAAHAAWADRLGESDTLHAGLDGTQTTAALAMIVRAHAGDAGTRFYTCGPAPFMAAVETALAAAGIPAQRLRSERFSAAPGTALNDDGAFTIVFARSGIEAEVPAGVPIIQVARTCGVDIPTSCEQGVCGACLSEVLEGTPTHHDAYLNETEQAGGKLMLPCVSRCAGKRLVLDR